MNGRDGATFTPIKGIMNDLGSQFDSPDVKRRAVPPKIKLSTKKNNTSVKKSLESISPGLRNRISSSSTEELQSFWHQQQIGNTSNLRVPIQTELVSPGLRPETQHPPTLAKNSMTANTADQRHLFVDNHI